MPIRNVRGRWHYRFQVSSRVYTGPTGLNATQRNVSAANRKEAEARQLVEQGKAHLLRLEPKVFSHAVESFLTWARGEHREHPQTWRRLKTSTASLLQFFGSTPLHVITAGDVEDFKAWRRSQSIKEVTIRHDLHTLSPLFRYARKHSWMQCNPLEDVEVPSDADAVRMYILTPAEEMLYFETCLRRGRQDLHDLGRLMIRQGCRPEELLSMEHGAVDLGRKQLRVVEGKTAAARRTLRLVDETAAILARRLAVPSRWVFPSPKFPDRHLVKLTGSHDRVLRAMGLVEEGERFVLYDLRHSFATRMAQRGMPLPTLAAILGHSSLRSVMKYVHPTQSHQDEAMLRYAELDRRDGWMQSRVTVS